MIHVTGSSDGAVPDVVAVFSLSSITSQCAALGMNPPQSSWLQRNYSKDSHMSSRVETGPATEDTKSVPWARGSVTEMTVHFGVPAEGMGEPLVLPGIPTSCWTDKHQAGSCTLVLLKQLVLVFSHCISNPFPSLCHCNLPGITLCLKRFQCEICCHNICWGEDAFLQHTSPREFSWSWLKLQVWKCVL